MNPQNAENGTAAAEMPWHRLCSQAQELLDACAFALVCALVFGSRVVRAE